MSTTTAQIIAGGEDLYHGGIRPIHIAWLSENSRPAWRLEPSSANLRAREEAEDAGEEPAPGTIEPVTWIPSHPDHILDEGILLVALRGMAEPTLVAEAERRLPDLLNQDRLELERVPAKELDALRELCAEAELPGKLVLSVLTDSSLRDGQIAALERYRAQVEVLSPTYLRSWGGWTGKTADDPHIYGSLAAASPTVGGLLASYRRVLSELRELGVVRSGNAPAGDYAEWLVSKATQGGLAPPSEKSWDVRTPEGERLQVKSRFVSDPETAGQRQLSTIRSWDFDALVIVLFDDEFGVGRAARLPLEVIRESARADEHVRGQRVIATEELLSLGENWTERLREAAASAG